MGGYAESTVVLASVAYVVPSDVVKWILDDLFRCNEE